MIRLSLGNVGSGKTLNEVRELMIYEGKRVTYTNIAIKNPIDNIKLLSPEMIMLKEIKETKKKRDGTVEDIYHYKLNMDFWKQQKDPVKIVIDEFHNIANARMGMSKKNQTFNKWLTMIRRVFGGVEEEEGELVLISQLGRQVDAIARDLCHQIRYHVCYYVKECEICGRRWLESSEMPERISVCRCSNNSLKKHSHFLIIHKFNSMEDFYLWKDMGAKTYYSRKKIKSISQYFKYYNTLQWDNLFEDY